MIRLLDNTKILEELVELHSSTFCYGNEHSFDVDVIDLAVDEFKFSTCPTVFADAESEYGLMYNSNRVSYKEAKRQRPNSIFLTTFITDNFTDMCFYPYDWIKVSSFYKNNTNIGKSQNFTCKPGLSLLGGWTPKRKIVFDKLKQHNDKILISYYSRQSGDWDSLHNIDSDYYVDPLIPTLDSPEFRKECIDGDRLFTQEIVNNTKKILYSYIIPTRLYSSSDIHFVAETEDDFQLKETQISSGFYVTEKTVKSILTLRPWTILGCENFLEHMRTLGFDTFGDIIDESYDLEPNTELRAKLVAESFIDFVNQDRKTRKLALQKIENRLIRNKKHMQDLYHWTLPAANMIKELA